MIEERAERRYSIQRILISRGYSTSGPFTAEISVETNYSEEIKVKLPEDRVLALISICDDLVLEALSLQFTAMREDMLAAIEEQKQKVLENQSTVEI